MSKELSIDEMSELMVLFEQAESLIDPKDKEALQKAEEVFNVACKMRAKVSGGLIDPNEVPNIWEKTLEVVPGAKDALHKKFNKARELLSLSQLKNQITH